MKTVTREEAEKYVNTTIHNMQARGINTPHHLCPISVAALLDENDMTKEEADHVKLYGRQPLAPCEAMKPMASVVPEGSGQAQEAPQKRTKAKAKL